MGVTLLIWSYQVTLVLFIGSRTCCKVSGAGPVITEDRVESDFLQDGCLSGAGGES